MPLTFAELEVILVGSLKILPDAEFRRRRDAFEKSCKQAPTADGLLLHLSKQKLKIGGIVRPLLTTFQIDSIKDDNDRGQSLLLNNGRLVLVEKLGKGGAGTVYLAFRRKPPAGFEAVAVKVIDSPRSGSTPAQRWKLETGFLCDADKRVHPLSTFVVKGLESFQDANKCGLVMEYRPGPTLVHVVNKQILGGRSLSVRRAIRLTDSILKGLEYLHSHGVIHRDVKPHNLIYEKQGAHAPDDYFVCVVDLGIAKDQHQTPAVTQTGSFAGTLYYMAPECFGNMQQADERTDLYGLAATLYFLLTGEPPAFALFLRFDSMLSQKTSHDISLWSHSAPDWSRTLLSEIRREIPPALAKLVFETLSVEMTDRPNGIAAFRERFDPILTLADQTRSQQQDIVRFRRGLKKTIDEVAKEIDAKLFPPAQNAARFLQSVKSQTSDFPDKFRLPLAVHGAVPYNLELDLLARDLNLVVRKIERHLDRLRADVKKLRAAFHADLVSYQQLLPRFLKLQHLFNHTVSGFV